MTRVPVLTAVVAIALLVAPAAAIATPGAFGDQLAVRAGLATAARYWGRTLPATVTVSDETSPTDSSWIASAMVGGAEAGDDVIEFYPGFFAAFPIGARCLRRYALTALIVHEYGHLLGYSHGVWRADRLGLMEDTAGWARWPLPESCHWGTPSFAVWGSRTDRARSGALRPFA